MRNRHLHCKKFFSSMSMISTAIDIGDTGGSGHDPAGHDRIDSAAIGRAATG